MKYIIFFLLPIITMSCSRDPVSPNGGAQEISFDLNGKHYSFSGDYNGTNTGVSGVKYPGDLIIKAYYGFFGFNNVSNNINMQIISDSLKAQTYSGSSFVIVPSIKAENASYIVNSDFSVIINSYNNGTVNGTFSGTALKIISITPYVTESATITNGVIKNIRIKFL